MPTLYIHAGMPKTGTSALQSFLYTNRKLLAERVNLYYPETGASSRRGGQHRDLFPITPEMWKQLASEVVLVRNHDIIISDERIYFRAFQDLQQPSLSILHKTFPGYTVKIILYVRRLDDWVKSSFNQMVKHNLAFKGVLYSDFIKKSENSIFVSKQINLAASLVGGENILLRIYDNNYLKNGDIVADFFDLLGHEIPDSTIRTTITNKSLPPETLSFLAESFLPISFEDPLRKKILKLLHESYSYPKSSNIKEEEFFEIEEEIDKIDAYIPGYKNLYGSRKLSLSFPEIDVKDPQSLFIISLLYLILMRQRSAPATVASPSNDYKTQLEAVLASRSWRITAPLRAISRWLRGGRT